MEHKPGAGAAPQRLFESAEMNIRLRVQCRTMWTTVYWRRSRGPMTQLIINYRRLFSQPV